MKSSERVTHGRTILGVALVKRGSWWTTIDERFAVLETPKGAFLVARHRFRTLQAAVKFGKEKGLL